MLIKNKLESTPLNRNQYLQKLDTVLVLDVVVTYTNLFTDQLESTRVFSKSKDHAILGNWC